jgi:HK97 family phage major capsid protein
MATIEDLILSIEVEQEQATKRRDRSLAEVKSILARAKADGRANLTGEEDTDCDAAMKRHKQSESDLQGIGEKMRRAREAQEAERQIEVGLRERTVDPKTTAGAKPAYDRVARVGSEERTYHKGNCRGGREFLMDVTRNFLYQDPSAQVRLARHMSEERVERGQYLERATGTGAFAGLTVPQYLTEMFAPAVAARRPFADAMTSLPLPSSGMTVNISRITTASSAALQANENDAVSETDMDDTLLTENVQTASGQQTVSRQAIDRGTGIEEVTMRDLQRRFATTLDSTIINQATTGLLAVATDITYNDAAPTGADLYPRILQGASASEAALLGQADPDVAVMHSRRWYWMQSQMVSTWPLIGQPGIDPRHGGENLAETYGSGFRGVLPSGMRVIVDNNIPTNIGGTQDTVVVVPRDESFLWEDPDAPQFIRAEQAKAANLGVLLVLFGYFAYTMRRYANSHQQITGTGLTTPTFQGVES